MGSISIRTANALVRKYVKTAQFIAIYAGDTEVGKVPIEWGPVAGGGASAKEPIEFKVPAGTILDRTVLTSEDGRVVDEVRHYVPFGTEGIYTIPLKIQHELL